MVKSSTASPIENDAPEVTDAPEVVADEVLEADETPVAPEVTEPVEVVTLEWFRMTVEGSRLNGGYPTEFVEAFIYRMNRSNVPAAPISFYREEWARFVAEEA